MKAGTTASKYIVFSELDTEYVDNIIFTFKSIFGSVKKIYPQNVVLEYGRFRIDFTQEDTLIFSPLGTKVEVKCEAQINYKGGAVQKSNCDSWDLESTLATQLVVGNKSDGAESDVIELVLEETVIVIESDSGGAVQSNDYNDLDNKPSINGVELVGNKTLEELGIENNIAKYLQENPVSAEVSEEHIAEAVDAYMAENPVSAEVADGSVTLAKLSDDVAEMLIQGGTSDDTSGNTIDILDGKKIAFIGDSITYGTGSGSVNDVKCDGYYNPYNPKISYPEIIKELHPNANIYNYAQAGLAIGENTSGNNLISILDSLINTISDVDYLVLSGGVNDSWVSGTTLGSLSDSFDGNYDKTTFYGALEQYVYNAINAYPNAYIMFLMTHNDVKKNYGDGITNMNDVIREVCAKWKIKLLDLNKNIGVNLSISPYSGKYMSDTTHPNEQCYRKFYAPLCNKALLDYGIDTSVSNNNNGGSNEGTKTIMGITATKTKTNYSVGETYSDSDISVIANYSDNTTTDITSDSTINSSSVNTLVEGTYIVNVEYSLNGTSYSDSITITVSSSQSSTWDDSVELNAVWSSATFSNVTVSQINGKNRITGTIMSDKTINGVSLKLISKLTSIDLVANEPYSLDVEFTESQNYTGNIVASATGSGDYPVTVYIRDLTVTEVSE